MEQCTPDCTNSIENLLTGIHGPASPQLPPTHTQNARTHIWRQGIRVTLMTHLSIFLFRFRPPGGMGYMLPPNYTHTQTKIRIRPHTSRQFKIWMFLEGIRLSRLTKSYCSFILKIFIIFFSCIFSPAMLHERRWSEDRSEGFRTGGCHRWSYRSVKRGDHHTSINNWSTRVCRVLFTLNDVSDLIKQL